MMDAAEFRKIMIPMIRRVIPGTITQEIVGVQPMSWPEGLVTGETYKNDAAAYSNPGDEVEHYWVTTNPSIFSYNGIDSEISQQWKWCVETFGEPSEQGRWFMRDGRDMFVDEQDRTMFILRWAK